MDDARIERRMSRVKRIILVLSGKGGVGKSSVSAQLALTMAESTNADGERLRVGLLDIDLTGPSIPRMLGVSGESVFQSTDGWVPVYTDASQSLGVMSVGFLLASKNDSVVWRGPKKEGMIRQFLGDVRWGDLDYLIIDTPPGTSDEHISIMEALHPYGPQAVMVTTPQAVSLADNLRSLDFTRKVSLPVIGLIENMSGYVCPHCSECTNVWGKGGGESLAEREHIPFLGRVPIDPGLVLVLDAADGGTGAATAIARYRESQTYHIFQEITRAVRAAAGL
ncbi:cytosolic Fe-S cluster assembly factor cfd1 [Malassezia cuniculi]|uniref:Cytosolic Fe-S cluster assembly factor cfd1 n=1 Tax=Malassezia cuniculi TaxID=948313 RepID=A0AAF0J6A4_9BASI|nr:cytosolic Fe-S cluster assembly factor cfd1 [Malassezia cuniculi]